MGTVIRKIIEIKITTPEPLTNEQAKAIFDIFKVKDNAHSVRVITGLPLSSCSQLGDLFYQIRDMCERIVRGEAYYEYPKLVQDTDAEGNLIWEDEEETIPKMVMDAGVKVPASESLAELQARALELIAQDYSFEGNAFASSSSEDVVDLVNYIIAEQIKYSNITNNATFDWWRAKIIAL